MTTTEHYADHFVYKLEARLLLVITAMNRFPYASYTLLVPVLCNLSHWDEFEAAIVKAEGDHALVNAIKNITCSDKTRITSSSSTSWRACPSPLESLPGLSQEIEEDNVLFAVQQGHLLLQGMSEKGLEDP